jgi:hypothetical protein
MRDVLERWRKQPVAQRRPASETVLIDAQGNLQSTRLMELWNRRDNRRIDLQE